MSEETYPTDENAAGQEASPAEEPQEAPEGQAPAFEPPAPAAPARRSPWLWVGLGVLALLVVAVILVFAFDLPGRLLGRGDKAAVAMPADTTIYLGVNLLQLTPEKLDRLLKPFLADISEVEFKDTEGMLAELDKSLQESNDFNFTQDIQPWLGQYLGVGIGGAIFGAGGVDPENIDLIVAIEARDRKAADEFLEKVRQGMLEQTDQPVSEQEYQGVTIYSHEKNQVAFARSKGLVLFGPRPENIQAAIDAQRGDSLGDQADFKALGRQLPRERFMTIFADGEQYVQLLSGALTTGMMGVAGLEQMTAQMEMIRSIGGSLSIVEEGLQLDALAVYSADKLSEAQLALLENSGQAARVAEVLPADTLLLFAGQGLNNTVQMNKETLGDQMGTDYDQAMQMLAAEIGFNLDTDLLAYLEGEFGLAIVAESNGVFAQMQGVPLGMIIVSRMNNHDALESTILKFNQYVSAQGVAVGESEAGENHIYTLGYPFIGEIAAYGLSQDHLAIGIPNQLVERVFNPGEALADEAAYQETWTHFPKDSTPVFYLKLPDLLEAIRGSMSGLELENYDQAVAFLNPVSNISLASSPFKNNQVHSTLIVFVESAE